jgi:CheY-like chemotaxis protein
MAVLSVPVPHPLILCIDDSEIGLRARKWLLASVGYEVLTATTAEEGVELFKKNPVVLVVADYFLGAKSGTETAREMKRLKPEVRILIVSGDVDEPAGLAFADGFLAKSEPTELLLQTIAQLVAAGESCADASAHDTPLNSQMKG